MNHDEIWSYRGDVDRTQADIVGYDVAANDGDIGTVEEETLEAGTSRLVVDTGFWLFGTKRVIPAGAVRSIDHDNCTVHLDMTKEDVKASPEYESAELYDGVPDRFTTYYAGVAWTRV